jgi:hypothetical protein
VGFSRRKKSREPHTLRVAERFRGGTRRGSGDRRFALGIHWKPTGGRTLNP